MSTDALRGAGVGPRSVQAQSGQTDGAGPSILAIFKRFFDVGATLLILAVTWPLLLMIAVLVSRDGPFLFSQIRVGRGDTRFSCLKFRTMYVDAEARLQAYLAADKAAQREWAHYQKLSRDPRITPLGRFLRKTSLDEMPQLINVLRGEMSLVGPRPIIAPETSGYDADAAYYRSAAITDYVKCRPGITGLWQVSGRHRTTHIERRRLDRVYSRSRSPWLDGYILFLTVESCCRCRVAEARK